MVLEAIADPEILDRCPACSAGGLFRVSAGRATNYLCQSCDRCWHLEDGAPRRVHPAVCPGCEWRTRCLARWDGAQPPPAAAPEGGL